MDFSLLCYSDTSPYSSPELLSTDDDHHHLPESSSSSSSASDTPTGCSKSNFSDEYLLLASNFPKKPAGRKKFREMRHPVYRGVRIRDSGKWVCEVREPNKKTRIWLGTFPTAEMAARAHDVSAIALRGRSACLNFADSAWRLPVPESTDPKDIQKAAAEAAEAFRPLESPSPSTPGDNNAITEECAYSVMAQGEDFSYMDEEAVFGMQGLLANMAEGLMLPPPECSGVGDEILEGEEADLSLWSY